MKSTTTTIEGNLPRDGIVCLNDARADVSDDTLEETIDLAFQNGYMLVDIRESDIFGTQYTLEKLVIEE